MTPQDYLRSLDRSAIELACGGDFTYKGDARAAELLTRSARSHGHQITIEGRAVGRHRSISESQQVVSALWAIRDQLAKQTTALEFLADCWRRSVETGAA